jgi:Uncharacterised nucleotidyltransferase
MAVAEKADPRAQAIRITAFGLPGVPGEENMSVAEDAWEPMLGSLTKERLTGLAVAAAESGWLELSDRQAEELLDRQREAMVWALLGERHLMRVGAALQAGGVDFLVLKGPALAHICYPDPSWRPYADLDLLVRTSDWRAACGILAEAGFRRDLPEPRPGFDERFGKAASHTGPEGYSIDLHRTLVLGPFGLWLRPEELFDSPATLELGGRRFGRLDDTALLVHACMHASLGWLPLLLLPVRDVAQVVWNSQVDWDLFADRVRRWRLGAVVRHSFETSSELLGAALPPETEAFAAARSKRRERRALASYTSDRRSRGGTALSTFKAIPGIRGKTAYARAMLLPQRGFVEARSANRRASYLRRWRIAASWLRPRPRRG